MDQYDSIVKMTILLIWPKGSLNKPNAFCRQLCSQGLSEVCVPVAWICVTRSVPVLKLTIKK